MATTTTTDGWPRYCDGDDLAADWERAGLDRLLGESSSPAGEHLNVTERLVVSPCEGRFQPEGGHDGADTGTVRRGEVIGSVARGRDVEAVRSAFDGELMGLLVQAGERVRTGQPVAWLRRT